jgi:protein phosphatase
VSGTLAVAAKTDAGKRRAENQDAVLVYSIEKYRALYRPPAQSDAAGSRLPDTLKTSEGPAHLLAVADGVGGGPGGRTASEQALASLSESVASKAGAEPSEALREAVLHANAKVLGIAQARSELVGMASTLTVAFVHDGLVWLANVGDSRVYLIRELSAWPMTYDHSWVAEQIEAGKMTEEEAARDPRRNLITRAVGAHAELEPDIYEPTVLEDGDILLLCSDGLSGVVEDAELAAMCVGKSPERAVEELIDLANERGGPDNVTVIVAQWSDDEAYRTAAAELPLR